MSNQVVKHSASNGGKSYEAPHVTSWGSVADLTRVGLTMPGGDARGGSVIPGNPDAGTPGGPNA
ncbi:MAG: lasso RiPP family leader peptide-containing protein [Pseudomonadota bacterium]|uniref:lasso RiPP family leader peptide-containing protein n=1 Tax=Halomonas sp. TaxID=1486246 RepID=UPI00397116D3